MTTKNSTFKVILTGETGRLIRTVSVANETEAVKQVLKSLENTFLSHLTADNVTSIEKLSSESGKISLELAVTVGLVAVIGYAFFSVSHTFAMGTDGRSNACRTFHTFSSQKADDKWAETDGLFCGTNDKPAAKSHDSIPATSDIPGTSVSIQLPDDTTMTVDVPAVIVDTPAETPVVDVPADDEPEVTPPAAGDNLGNPGNTKDVGHAGENPNGQGTMDDDNTGGNGNGEHGNQGVNH